MWRISLFIFVSATKCVLGNYTFTYEMASKCKEHLSTHGYSYDVMYEVSPQQQKLSNSEEMKFEMHIAILAASNGHILLSPVPQPTATDAVYEIVVGGGGNKFTDLRRLLKKNSKSVNKTPNILSPIEYRAFYIKVHEDGLVEFGKEGDPLPLVSYFDTDPVPVRYFSFTSWNGVEAKFLYDCPVAYDNGSLSNTSQSELVEPTLSSSEQLRRTLLQGRMTTLPPSASEILVEFGVQLTTLSYDAFETKLETGLAIIMKWTDNSLAWNSTKFNGTTNIGMHQGEIWTPKFVLLNSDNAALVPKTANLLQVKETGEVTFFFQTRISSWCLDYLYSYSGWPRDMHFCLIVLKPHSPHEIINIKSLDPDSDEFMLFTDLGTPVSTGWEVYLQQNVTSFAKTYFKKGMLFFTEEIYASEGYHGIFIKIIRNSTSYNLVFYTPLLVLLVFLLMSFFMEPLKTTRIWYYLVTAQLVCAGLTFIDYLVPCHTVPSILVLYTVVLGGALLAMMIQVILLYKIDKKHFQTRFISNILHQPTLRSVFCLEPLKLCNVYESINDGYESATEDDPELPSAPARNIETMESDSKPLDEKYDFAIIIDKTMFVVYSIVFAVMLADHF